ncbi:sensor histidine kinase [Dactylosporangium sp. NPDC051541]|uniref:sensor histidine kinase n=1 Tax=Dactylosporangium sp. NPDC051541 TaxID=3363977 RepID=UPI00378F3A25
MRAWAVRQWPVTVGLVVLLVGDVVSVRWRDVPGQWWVWPGAIALCALALAAARWPVGAGVVGGVLLVGWSSVLRLAGAQVVPELGTLLAVEVGAVAVLIVVAVRRESAVVASAAVSSLLVGGVAAQWLRVEPSAGAPIHDRLLSAALLLCVCVMAGRFLRNRDAERARATRAAVIAARERERLGLARELHEVVARHTPAGDAEAQAALRCLAATLRGGDSGEAQRVRAGADLVADLKGVTQGGGTPVMLEVELEEPVPAAVSTTVLRLVRESVANARRHAAGARRIDAKVRTGDGLIRVEVSDDGRPAAAKTSGFGLIGLRERVHLLGGEFAAGRTPEGGWLTAAELPLREPEADVP